MPSGMDEVFGKMPRPDTPDFWKMSDAVLKLDGRVEAAMTNEEKHEVFVSTVGEYVDIESLSYMAVQRAIRVVPPSPKNADMIQKLAAIFMDAFIIGCEFQRGKD